VNINKEPVTLQGMLSCSQYANTKNTHIRGNQVCIMKKKILKLNKLVKLQDSVDVVTAYNSTRPEDQTPKI